MSCCLRSLICDIAMCKLGSSDILNSFLIGKPLYNFLMTLCYYFQKIKSSYFSFIQ